MNLYFRLIYVLLKVLLFAPKIRPEVLAETEVNFHALPADCDINLHITNSRYLSFMDLGRTYLMGQLNLLPQLFKRKWGPVVQTTELTFIKPIMLGQSFKLVTHIIYWDAKYFYMEQKFLVNQELYAVGTVRGLFIGRKRKIPTAEILALLDNKINAPPMPEFIKHWQALLDVKKNSD